MTEVSKIMISDNLGMGMGRELPRSPRSISPISSRRGSLRPDKDSEPPTPISPPVRLTRKRAASLNTDAANHPHIENLALNSANTSGPPTGSREQVCLCQPDPKIPRPRNAFILYRQHYQAQVVAANPGLANPEISKIIGEQWRDQPADVKNEWKRLAEEEKQRHQRQYPDYRYQPRRAGKPGGSRPISSGSSDDPGRCPKCGGRYISTPSTPLTPFPPAQFGAPARTERLLPPFTPAPPPPPRNMEGDRARFAPAPVQTQTPRTAPPPEHLNRPQYPQPISAGMQVGPLRDRDDEMDYAGHSPRKRHRPSEPSASYPSPSWSGPPPPRYGRPPMSAIGYDDRRGPLPPPGQLMHHPMGMMEPPPRPLNMQPPYTARSNTFDESLRLPPLQTQILSPPAGLPHRSDMQERSDSQARSVEAMVMTIPYLNKIKVLAKISPPLAPSGPSSPAQEVRGAVVAIEGSDPKLLADVGKYIQDYVSKDPDCLVRTWEPSKAAPESADVEMGRTKEESQTPTSKNDNEPFLSYLGEIQSWHEKSAEISKFITTAPATVTSASNTPSPEQKPATVEVNSSPSAAPSPSSSPPSAAAAAASSSTPPSLQHSNSKARIPVALLPCGFSLTTSDSYASSIPINDAYAPVDHWQWMATLWRGIVGPDLTVYVKRVTAEDRDEMSRVGAVEVRTDHFAPGVIVVRVDGNNGGVVEEKILRRVGFEVLEGVRSLVGGEVGYGVEGSEPQPRGLGLGGLVASAPAPGQQQQLTSSAASGGFGRS